MNPTALSAYRASQPAVSFGPGKHLVSPQKRASKRKREHNATIFFDLDARRRRAKKELDELLSPSTPPTATTGTNDDTNDDMEIDCESEWVDEDLDQVDANTSSTPLKQLTPAIKPRKSKSLTPNYHSINLYCKWRILLPTLIEPLLAYTSNSIGKAAIAVGVELAAVCKDEASLCETRETSVLCLYFDCMYH